MIDVLFEILVMVVIVVLFVYIKLIEAKVNALLEYGEV